MEKSGIVTINATAATVSLASSGVYQPMGTLLKSMVAACPRG
jgi:hypothetical protein